VLNSIPGLRVYTAGFRGKQFLGKARSTIITVIRAYGTLASDAIVSGEALARTGRAVAGALVRALYPWMQVIRVHNRSNPGIILGACSQGAVSTHPLSFTVETREALAVVVHFACAVTTATVFTETSLSMSLLIPRNLAP
jgi:hypothetical protein